MSRVTSTPRAHRRGALFAEERLSARGRRLTAFALLAATATLPACAEILGLEPPGSGTGGSGNTTQTGGNGGSGGTGANGGSGGTAGAGGTGGIGTGEILAVEIFSAPGSNDLRDVAIGPDGEVYVTGTYTGTTSFRDCPLPTVGSLATFLVKLTPDLDCTWVATASTTGTQVSFSRIALRNKEVWVIGSGDGYIDLFTNGGIPTIEAQGTDALILGFAEDSTILQAYRIGGSGNEYGTAIAAGDHIYGLFEGIGGGTITASLNGAPAMDYSPSFGGIDGVLLGIEPQGLLFTWPFGSSEDDAARSLAVVNDRIAIGGQIGGGADLNTDCKQGRSDEKLAFAFDFDQAGTPGPTALCDAFGGFGPSYTTDLAAGPGGAFAMAGVSFGPTDLGCTAGGVVGANKAWLRRGKDATSCISAELLAGPEESSGGGVLWAGDTLYFGGTFTGTLEGTKGQGSDVFVRRYAGETAELLWSRGFGSTGTETFSGFAVSPEDGTTLVVGSCNGSDFAGTARPCSSDGDGYLVRLGP